MIPSGDRYRKVAASLVPVLAAVAVTIIAFLGAGCDEKMQPLPPESSTGGTIAINPEPNSINAPWQITGPDGFDLSGARDLPLVDRTAGNYTLTWGVVAGWTTPSPATATQALVANETLTFTGTYVAQPGTITIDAEPNSISAPWQITGPGGFDLSGTKDASFSDMIAGSYTLTWGALAGWNTPNPAVVTQTLALSGTVTFAGLYSHGFVSIPPGTFMMGSPTTDMYRSSNETQHQVTLTHGVYVQTTEVTNQQYLDLAQWAYLQGYARAEGDSSLIDDSALDGSTQVLMRFEGEISFNNGVFNCINPDHPVKYVTWYGSVAYCDWLSLQQGLPRAYSHSTWQCNSGNPYTATGYRLPTEAEWEYACRAGTQTPFNTGSCLDAGTEANYYGPYYTGCPTGPYVGWTVPVGSYPANAFGLYDMHGNIFEWCNDWWGLYGGTETDPVGPGAGSGRVIRGGYWNSDAPDCRSAGRGDGDPNYAGSYVGFRPVRSAP